MKTGNYQIPFDQHGNQMHYPDEWCGKKVRWQDNAPFEDSLTYVGYRRGRPAAYFVFHRVGGAEVIVFLKDFESMVPLMSKGVIAGKFAHTKRGTNYGTKLV